MSYLDEIETVYKVVHSVNISVLSHSPSLPCWKGQKSYLLTVIQTSIIWQSLARHVTAVN